MVRNYFSKFSDFIKQRDYPEIKRIINNYVDRVDVYKDKVTVTFKVAFDFDNCADGELKYTFDSTIGRDNLVA